MTDVPRAIRKILPGFGRFKMTNVIFARRRRTLDDEDVKRGLDVLLRRSAALEPIRRAEAAPVLALHAHGHVDLAHHDGGAVAHVAGVALDQIAAGVLTRR